MTSHSKKNRPNYKSTQLGKLKNSKRDKHVWFF